MASSNSLSSRLEELRSRNPQSPPGEITYSGYNTPNRYSGSFMPSHSQPLSNDARASLQRRFTADSGNVPTLTPIGQQPSQVMDPVDMYATTLSKAQALEKKKVEYEKLREQRRRFQAELEKFDRQQALEEKELHRMATDLQATDLQGLNLSTGHQSEPTTPPEYRDHVFPSIYSRRNRYSSSSLVSPPGINNRLSRSGSQLTSPPTEPAQTQPSEELDKLPSKSVPGSRRGSTDRISSYLPENNLSSQRSAAKTNRYSMPVTSSVARKRDFVSDYASAIGMGPINTTGFLFGDDDDKPSAQKESTTSPDVKTYLQMNTTDDKFPILIRNNHHPGLLSASSAALDLALSQSPGSEPQSNGWPTFARHRPSQQSLPQNVFEAQQSGQRSLNSPTSNSQQSFDASSDSPTSIRQLNRRSMEASLASYAQKSVLNQSLTNGTASMRPSLANLQSSFSTNDIPTLKNVNGLATAIAPPKATAQQQFHNHNASLGRIPPSAVNNRQSREIVTSDTRREEPANGFKQLQSDLQASAAPFGPSIPASMSVSVPSDPHSGPMSPSSINQYPGAAYYGGYGMQLMNMGMTPMQMGGHMGYASQMSLYQAQNQYSPYSQYGQQARFQDSQARVIQQRRLQNVEDVARFTNTKIENYQGDIYALCKDQHGCRYLQKQLEGRNADTIHLIFAETNQHVVELMTDPFGNYLCQKLLEYSNDDQRTVLINNAAPQMVKIALNQHGTRALQKMIEFISTPEQIQTIIHALKDRVVELIKDLNGNHVIQKCLNRLTPEDAQFIFDAVGTNCVVVGTHRHGCCVLQRCIDHASGYQKAQLISQITENAFSLVQDPFGNYVLQYIVDLAEPVFTNPLCYSFQSSIPALSKQKFSSNVIEKCLRGSEPQITTMMIEEMLNANELEKMLRDSFANYVVQTALDYADAETRNRLVEAIRPILPAIRQTPYGRRIQSKILGAEGQDQLSGVSTPHDISSPGQLPIGRQLPTVPGTFGSQGAGVQQYTNGLYSSTNQNAYGTNGMTNATQYTPLTSPNPSTHGHRLSNGSSTYNHFSPATNQNSVHQPVPLYGRVGQTNGFNYF